MSYEFVLAVFLMGVGLSVAGAGTHLYQGVLNKQAELTLAGSSYLAGLGNLAVSFFCGPYIMLQMSVRPQANGSVSASMVLVATFVAFGWAFITGLMLVALFLAFTGH